MLNFAARHRRLAENIQEIVSRDRVPTATWPSGRLARSNVMEVVYPVQHDTLAVSSRMTSTPDNVALSVDKFRI